MTTARTDGRRDDEMRPVEIVPGFLRHAEGSTLIRLGGTHVLCAASVEENVPPFLLGKGQGWVTAEYSMLPRATTTRTRREVTVGRPSGRTQEIQRLIGRALRAAVDLSTIGERTILVDCDVIEADGGTRTASITGGWVALALALEKVVADGKLDRPPALRHIAATSVGVVQGRAMLDLAYVEDSTAQVDFNVVMNGDGEFVEIQGTAERGAFARSVADRLLDLASAGVADLVKLQAAALTSARGS